MTMQIVICFFYAISMMAEQSSIVEEIQRYKLKQGKDFNYRYGSGIAFKKESTYGSQDFYLFPSGSFLITNGKDQRSKEDIPHLAIASLKKDKFYIKTKFPLYFQENQELQVDLEGISASPGDIVWLVDEGNNALLEISTKTGHIRNVLKAGKELPAEINTAEPNRGLESISVTPNRRIYTALQSPLAKDIQQDRAQVRLYEYSLRDKKVRTFYIPVNQKDYVSLTEVKIGDLTAISNREFLLIEQGDSRDRRDINRVYRITLPAQEKQPVEKELLLDLNQHGWKYKKAEGIMLLNANTIGVINDWSDDLHKNMLWLFTLKDPLISWGWVEYSLAIILLLIFIVSLYMIVLAYLPNKSEQNG